MENEKYKNIQVLKYMIILGICILVTVGALCFNSFKDGYYREWLTLISALLGAIISGILTMSGVVLTLNRELNNQKKMESIKNKEKKEKIKNLAMIVHSEIKAYSNSIKDYNINMIELKIGTFNTSDKEFEDKINKWNLFNDIYFFLPNTREIFYKVISEYYNKNILDKFTKIYNNHERVKSIYNENIPLKSVALLNSMHLNCFKSSFTEYKFEVFEFLNDDNYKFYLSNNELNKYEDYHKELGYKLEKIKNEDIFSNELNELLNYLENIYIEDIN